LWFSKASAFNDPFECALHLDFSFDDLEDEDWEAIRDHWAKKIEEEGHDSEQFREEALVGGRPSSQFCELMVGIIEKSYQTVHQETRTFGIACFSERVDDILMWAHYSQGHTGFCLEFGTEFPPLHKAHQVVYGGTAPKMDPGRS